MLWCLGFVFFWVLGGLGGRVVEGSTWNVVIDFLIGCIVVFLPVQSGSPGLLPVTPFHDQTLMFGFDL